jgi:hypothetical protein
VNTDQLLSLLRTVLQMIGTYVVANHVLGANSSQLWDLLAGIILMAAPTIWSIYAHTDAANIKKVTAMPDVKEIVVKANAGNGVGAALADPNQPKVVTSGGTS